MNRQNVTTMLVAFLGSIVISLVASFTFAEPMSGILSFIGGVAWGVWAANRLADTLL